MKFTDVLSFGYKKYKDESIEIKNGYSLSFENLEMDIEMDTYEEADICNLSDDWTPVGQIHKKSRKSLSKRIIQYTLWCSALSGIGVLCYYTIIELYH